MYCESYAVWNPRNLGTDPLTAPFNPYNHSKLAFPFAWTPPIMPALPLSPNPLTPGVPIG